MKQTDAAVSISIHTSNSQGEFYVYIVLFAFAEQQSDWLAFSTNCVVSLSFGLLCIGSGRGEREREASFVDIVVVCTACECIHADWSIGQPYIYCSHCFLAPWTMNFT